MCKILVTGGTGFIGSNLVRGLVESGHAVRVLDNNYRGDVENIDRLSGQIEFIQGDIRDFNQVNKAMEGIKTVYHLAFINGTENFYKYPDLVLEVGIKGHLNVMEASKNNGIEKFIFASSSEIYQTPDKIPTPEEIAGSIPDVKNPRYSYGGAKLMGELLTLHYVLGANMKRIIFRPHNVYGPAMGFEHVIPQLVKKIFHCSKGFSNSDAEIEIQGTGNETRAFCYIDDAVDGILILGKKAQDKDIFHLGVQEETRISDLITKIGEVLGVRIKIVPAELAKGSTKRRMPDISKLKNIGYEPKVWIKDGLEKTVLWYKDYFLKNENY